MLVVPENKVTTLLHLSHYTDIDMTLIYTNANKLYQITKFQKNSHEIIIHTDKHYNPIYQHSQQMLVQFIRQQF